MELSISEMEMRNSHSKWYEMSYDTPEATRIKEQ